MARPAFSFDQDDAKLVVRAGVFRVKFDGLGGALASSGPWRKADLLGTRLRLCGRSRSRAVKVAIVLVVRSHRRQLPGQLKIDVEIAGVQPLGLPQQRNPLILQVEGAKCPAEQEQRRRRLA